MADVSDQSSFALGLANIANQNSGPNAIVNQANTAANTALTQQQTQGAAIQNANARLQFQLFQRAMNHLSDFSGQDGPTHDADDASGVVPTSALPSANAPQAIKSRITPEMDVGASASDRGLIESSLESNYNVNPMGTPQQQQAIVQAEAYATQMKLSGNKGLADAADQRVQMLKDLRDMDVATRRNDAQVDASGHYDKLSSVVNAPDGKAWDTLEAIAPDSANMIKRKNPDATPDELEDIAKDTAGHVAGFMHRFTDRPVKVGDDEYTYDEKSGLRVDGIPMRGVDPAKQAELLKQATEVKTFKNNDGTDTTEEQYKHDGYKNPNLWVTHAVAEMRARNSTQSAVEAKRNQAARVPPQAGQPGQPGQPQPGQPQPGQPQPGQPQPGQPQPGQPQAGQPQAGQPGQPQPPPKDNGLLPGVNPDAVPKIQSAPVVQGTSIKPADLTVQQETAKESIAQQKLVSEQYVQTQKTDALIRAAQRETAALANNPRMTGPGSEVAQALAKIRTFVTGKPPDSLVDLGTLNKVLLQMGAQNVRQALDGQKITQAEFMKLLGEGNPNTEQPLATVNKLLTYAAAQNDYDMRFNRTKQIALQRGANPIGIDGALAGMPGADRGDYVEGKVGVRPSITPPARPGQTTSGAPAITSQAQYDALPKGAKYTDANGKPHVKGGQ
jgi:hypothetical protein